MRRIYLDSNVLIAHFSVSKSEEAKRGIVEEALKVIAQLQDIQLCTSMWFLAETINILVSRQGMDRGKAAEIESQFVNQKRLGSVKLCFVDVSPKKDYDFMEFFQCRPIGTMLKTIDFIGFCQFPTRFHPLAPSHSLGGRQKAHIFWRFHEFPVG